MDLLLIDAAWDEEIKLGQEVLDKLKGKKSVALFAAVQFLKLDKAKEQLQNLGIEVKTTKAKRAHEPIQILGCDTYPDSVDINTDAVLYIGDGMFHPKALLLAGAEEVVVWDPRAKSMKIVKKEEVEKELKRRDTNIKKFLSADTIGILVTTKPGQQYLNAARELKQKLENKKCYIFIADTINLMELENFPFIECWVNTACPRIGFDDILELEKPLINIREALDNFK